MAGSRSFDGVDDQIIVSLGGSGITNEAFTLAVVLKPANTDDQIWIEERNDSGNSDGLMFGYEVGEYFGWFWPMAGATNPSSALSLSTSDWQTVILGKAAGTAAPRFSRIVLPAGTASHSTGDVSMPDKSVIHGWRFGNSQYSGYEFAGQIALIAVWKGTNLSDANRATLTTLEAFEDLSPSELWRLDGDPPFAGSNTSTQSSITGTTHSTDEPSGLWGSAPQSIAVGQATETNTAPNVSVSTTRSVAITAASETNTAQSVTASTVFSATVSEASETDTAQGVDVETSASAALSEASETDTAQGVGFSSSQSVDVEMVEETDTAGDVGLETSVSAALTEATETDTAQGVIAPSLMTIAQAAETDSAQGVGMESSVEVELSSASEADTAQGVFLAHGVALSTASETDSASDLEVELATSLAVATAEESDLAERIVVDGGDAPVRTIAQEPWQGYIPY